MKPVPVGIVKYESLISRSLALLVQDPAQHGPTLDLLIMSQDLELYNYWLAVKEQYGAHPTRIENAVVLMLMFTFPHAQLLMWCCTVSEGTCADLSWKASVFFLKPSGRPSYGAPPFHYVHLPTGVRISSS